MKNMRGASVAERLEAYSTPEPNTGCILWIGARTKRSGYGQIQIGNRSELAHRAAMRAAGFELPEGSAVIHSEQWSVKQVQALGLSKRAASSLVRGLSWRHVQ